MLDDSVTLVTSDLPTRNVAPDDISWNVYIPTEFDRTGKIAFRLDNVARRLGIYLVNSTVLGEDAGILLTLAASAVAGLYMCTFMMLMTLTIAIFQSQEFAHVLGTFILTGGVLAAILVLTRFVSKKYKLYKRRREKDSLSEAER